MSNYLEIENTIVKSFLNHNLGYPVEVSGLPTDIDVTGLHLKIHNLNADTNPVTLGESGMDESKGFLQVDIKYPVQKGHTVPLGVADEIAALYTAGLSIVGSGVEVRIERTNLSPKMIIGGLMQYSLTIYYFVRTSRN